MLSRQFVNEFFDLIDSDYTTLDFLRFVQNNYEAQTIIAQHYDEDDVRKVVCFLESHDDCEIESVLNTDPTEYYDPDSQANHVHEYLSTCKTISEMTEKINKMIQEKTIKSKSETFRLHPNTIKILEQVMKQQEI